MSRRVVAAAVAVVVAGGVAAYLAPEHGRENAEPVVAASTVPYPRPAVMRWRPTPLRPFQPVLPVDEEPVPVQSPEAAPDVADLPPWQRYAVAVAVPAAGRARVTIVLDDLGIDAKAAAEAARLPGPLTLAFLPYAANLPAQAAAARGQGHELIVHMPMAPLGPSANPGPNVLRGDLPPAELQRRLDHNLGRFSGYVGLNNHMGSALTADRPAMELVMRELKARGLLFLDSRTTASTVAATVAREMGVPYASRQVFLDNDRRPAAIRRQLAELEHLARRDGSAIAIGHPYPETLAMLAVWLPELAKRGIDLVPLSAVVKP